MEIVEVVALHKCHLRNSPFCVAEVFYFPSQICEIKNCMER